MCLGVGVGASSDGMFHLLTHAFFKALLFLAAGLVIHHLAGEQDIRRMGGLKRFMPVTWLMFLVGSLGLVGGPPSSSTASATSSARSARTASTSTTTTPSPSIPLPPRPTRSSKTSDRKSTRL